MTLFIGHFLIITGLCSITYGLAVYLERNRAAQRESESFSNGFRYGYRDGMENTRQAITDAATEYAEKHPPMLQAKFADHKWFKIRTHEETDLMLVKDERNEAAK